MKEGRKLCRINKKEPQESSRDGQNLVKNRKEKEKKEMLKGSMRVLANIKLQNKFILS